MKVQFHRELKVFSPQPVIQKYLGSLVQLSPTLWELSYFAEGRISEIAGLQEPSSTLTWGQDLWKDTCFELFLGFPGEKSYWEWNFSPQGQACLYKFSDYRIARPLDLALKENLGGFLGAQLEVEAQTLAFRGQINGAVDPELSWRLATCSQVEVSLNSILKCKTGEMSYWGLRHAATKPDFHDRTQWVRLSL